MKKILLNYGKLILGSLSFVAFTLAGSPVGAQQVTVRASIDSLQLLVGEQTKIHLEVSMDANRKLQLPVINDTLVRGVEVLDIARPDTQKLNDNKSKIKISLGLPVNTSALFIYKNFKKHLKSGHFEFIFDNN